MKSLISKLLLMRDRRISPFEILLFCLVSLSIVYVFWHSLAHRNEVSPIYALSYIYKNMVLGWLLSLFSVSVCIFLIFNKLQTKSNMIFVAGALFGVAIVIISCSNSGLATLYIVLGGRLLRLSDANA